MLQIAEIFGNNMVLQREKPIRVWGIGEPGAIITVSIQRVSAEIRTDADGRWNVVLPPLYASEEETLNVTDGSTRIAFEHVAVGEVWLAGGQSNMEFFMRYDKDFKESVKHCENRNIRYFDYPRLATEEMRSIRDFSLFGYWRSCNKENLQYFSAVAYYFARDLQESLGVPVGIIGCNCGGTRACCWMDEDSVRKCGSVWLEDYELGMKEIPDLQAAKQAYLDNPMMDKSHPFDEPNGDRMMYGIPQEELQQMFEKMAAGGSGMTIGPWHEWRPGGLYHTMLQKVIPYTVRGVIWYQGESDEDHPEIYADMMCGLIQCWRRDWQEELPFLMTQLAPFGEVMGNGGKFYPLLREQQEEVTRRLAGVFCASIGDVGNVYDIHPKEKRPVGKRLALLARGHVYQEDILCDAPMPVRAERNQNRIEILFANAEGGLILKGDTLQALRVFGRAGELLEGEYQFGIDGDRVILYLPENLSDREVTVKFAREAYYEVNLYNRSDIPAKPFELVLN